MGNKITKRQFKNVINKHGGKCMYRGHARTMFITGLYDSVLNIERLDTAFNVVVK